VKGIRIAWAVWRRHDPRAAARSDPRRRDLDDAAASNAARVAAVDAEPWADDRASAGYRRHLVQVLVERALRAILRDTSTGAA
jgi:CO/xanthine dehydrogenase FAD-binding subunit